MRSVSSNPSVDSLREQTRAIRDLSRRGALIDALMIAGELFVAAAGGYAAVTNTNPFTGGSISSSWDGMARVAVASGAALTAADSVRRTGRLIQNLRALG